MKLIQLTQGKFAEVDDSDYDYLMQWKWYARKGSTISKTFYAISTVLKLRMHRVILGVINPKILVDHEDSNGLNNQRNNIRICTSAQNLMNTTKRDGCKSKYKGVTYQKVDKKHWYWCSRIKLNGVLLSLKYFKTEIEAALHYDEVVKIHFREFAKLNFPDYLKSLPKPIL